MVLKSRRCPCCGEILTFTEYFEQNQDKGEEEEMESIRCMSCKNIIMSKNKIINYNGFLMVFMIAFIGLLPIFLSLKQTILMIIPVIIIWALLHQYGSYLWIEMKCYGIQEVQDIERKGGSIAVIVLLALMFYAAIAYLLLGITDSYKAKQKEKNNTEYLMEDK